MFLPIVPKVCKLEPASYRHQHQTIPEVTRPYFSVTNTGICRIKFTCRGITNWLCSCSLLRYSRDGPVFFFWGGGITPTDRLMVRNGRLFCWKWWPYTNIIFFSGFRIRILYLENVWSFRKPYDYVWYFHYAQSLFLNTFLCKGLGIRIHFDILIGS